MKRTILILIFTSLFISYSQDDNNRTIGQTALGYQEFYAIVGTNITVFNDISYLGDSKEFEFLKNKANQNPNSIMISFVSDPSKNCNIVASLPVRNVTQKNLKIEKWENEHWDLVKPRLLNNELYQFTFESKPSNFSEKNFFGLTWETNIEESKNAIKMYLNIEFMDI